MRFDRLITLGLIRPFRRAGSNSCSRRVPVLMYHSITDEPESEVSPYYRTNTSPAVFRQHVECLAERGYRSLSVEQLVDSLHASNRQSTFSHPAVVITFDDGFRNFYTDAFPVLKRYGFTATMFLPTAFIGDTPRHFRPRNSRGRVVGGQECLTWKEVREMHSQGIEFGSHTVSHPRLADLPWTEVVRELRESRDELQQQVGNSVTAFAYPFAFPQADAAFVSGIRALLAETGYTSCVTTELGRVGLGDDPYRLKRLPANNLDDLDFFRAKLEGCYDWLGGAQRAAKKIKRLRSARQDSRTACGAGPNPASPAVKS